MNRRGTVLATSLVLLVVLAMICVAITRLLFGRYTLAAKEAASTTRRYDGQSVQAMVNACLQNSTDIGASTCSMGGLIPAEQSCIASIGATIGKPVSVSFSGSPPQCKMAVTVE